MIAYSALAAVYLNYGEVIEYWYVVSQKITQNVSQMKNRSFRRYLAFIRHAKNNKI